MLISAQSNASPLFLHGISGNELHLNPAFCLVLPWCA